MAVREIYSQGGIMPEPEEKDMTESKRTDTVLDRIINAKKRLAEEELSAHIMRQALIPEKPAPPPPQEQPFKISANLDLGAIINGALETVKTIPASIRSEYDGKFGTMEKVLVELKNRVENPPPHEQKSPLQHYREIKAEIDEVVSGIKKDLGYGGNVVTSTSDLPALIQLEESRAEREDRARRWQEESDERRQKLSEESDERHRRWQIDDRKWAQEFKLRELEFFEGRKLKDKAADSLSDLVGSFTESMGGGEEGEAREIASDAGNSAKGHVALRPKSFQCKCGSPIDIPKDISVGTEVTCGTCKMKYVLEDK